MSTKLKPGAFDCYAKLVDDEPYFVLRGKDPDAPALVEEWAARRESLYGNYAKLDEARRCAEEMRTWRLRRQDLQTYEEQSGMMPHESAQPCGCDPGAKWICERHREGEKS